MTPAPTAASAAGLGSRADAEHVPGRLPRSPRSPLTPRCAVTNTSPVGAFRGAGRPEAASFIERLMDMGADELGSIRPSSGDRNLIQPEQFPYPHGDRDALRHRRLRAAARRGASASPATTGLRAEQQAPPAAGDRDAARHRPLHLRRDHRRRARAASSARSRCIPTARRRCGSAPRRVARVMPPRSR